MAKWLARTTKDNFLQDGTTGDTIPNHRPAVVRPTSFFKQRLTLGQIEVLNSKLPNSAKDADFEGDFEKNDRKVPAEWLKGTDKPEPDAPNTGKGRKAALAAENGGSE